MLVFDGDISEHKIGSEQLADVSLFPWPSADSFLLCKVWIHFLISVPQLPPAKLGRLKLFTHKHKRRHSLSLTSHGHYGEYFFFVVVVTWQYFVSRDSLIFFLIYRTQNSLKSIHFTTLLFQPPNTSNRPDTFAWNLLNVRALLVATLYSKLSF